MTKNKEFKPDYKDYKEPKFEFEDIPWVSKPKLEQDTSINI